MNTLDKVSLKVEVTTNGSDEEKGSDEDDGWEHEMLYHAFTDVEAKIFLQEEGKAESKLIGEIQATLVDRQKIPEGCFHVTFDEHSADMEWVGCTLLENRYGRTMLESLREHDLREFDFMYISSFGVNHDSPDVAAAALYKFLHDPEIKGDLEFGCWRVSSAAYVLPGCSSADDETNSAGKNSNDRKRKRDADCNAQAMQQQAEPFLRLGFFQDQALIHKDRKNARILVATYGHWNQNIRSSAQIASTRLISYEVPKPGGKDLEILEAVEALLSTTIQDYTVNLSAVTGLATSEPPRDNASTQQLNGLRTQIQALRRTGGERSIARSTALHTACEKNSPKVLQLLLEIEPAAIESKNSQERTPLMTAANNAAGRCSITNGLDDTTVIDQLLAAGANKSSTDPSGMTAYGYFRNLSKLLYDTTRFDKRGTLTFLESKLRPPGGPTAVDLAGGIGGNSGFVDYRPEDDEADREMGRGRYAY